MVDYTAASGYTTDGSGRRQYVDRDDANGVQGTYLIADDRNMDRNELVNAVKASGQALSATNHGQLLLAIQALGNIRPWSQAVSDAIGGYWLGAVTVDGNGAYWKSAVAANTTVPGASGAKWNSLFDGYATQEWASKQFLQLDSTAAQTVNGPVIFSDATQVPAVTDWKKYQAIGAADGDLRYPRLNGSNVYHGDQSVDGSLTLQNNKPLILENTSGLGGSSQDFTTIESMATGLERAFNLFDAADKLVGYFRMYGASGRIVSNAGTFALLTDMPQPIALAVDNTNSATASASISFAATGPGFLKLDFNASNSASQRVTDVSVSGSGYTSYAGGSNTGYTPMAIGSYVFSIGQAGTVVVNMTVTFAAATPTTYIRATGLIVQNG